MLVMTDENYPGPGVSFGRLDQYLDPFYRTSLEKGMGMDGKDMTNELTYLLPDVINEMSPIFEPKPNVSLHKSPPGITGTCWLGLPVIMHTLPV